MKTKINNIPDPQNTVKLNTRKRVQITFPSESKTKQYFREECNINHIVAKFSQTGQLPSNVNRLEPQYGDAPTIDLKQSLDQVKKLHAEFFEMPYEMRKKFKNKPENYAQFLSQYEADPASFQMPSNTDKKSSDLQDEGTPVSRADKPKKELKSET